VYFKVSGPFRAIVMIFITVSIILPLSLAKKLDRLAGVSAVAIGFYIIFSIYVKRYVKKTKMK
jgi:amino acid permease